MKHFFPIINLEGTFYEKECRFTRCMRHVGQFDVRIGVRRIG
jgi:hypothetical protein